MERGQDEGMKGMKRLYHYGPMLTLAIFATIAAVIMQLLIFCDTMIFNTDYYVWTISKSGADTALYNELDEYFGQYSNPTSIPKEVYTKSLDQKKVSATAKKLVRSSLEYMFGRSLSKPVVDYDFTDFEVDVIDYVEKYSEANNIEKDQEYYSLIDNTLDNAEKKVVSSFDILMVKKLADSHYSSIFKKIVPEMGMAMGICLFLLLSLLGLMWYIDRHHPFDLPYWIGTILFCSSLLFLIPSLYLRFSGYFDGLFMEDPSIYYAITGAIYGVTDRLIIVNCILLALGLVFIIFAQIIHVFRVRYAQSITEEIDY